RPAALTRRSLGEGVPVGGGMFVPPFRLCGERIMEWTNRTQRRIVGAALLAVALALGVGYAQDSGKKAEPAKNSDEFKAVMTRMQAAQSAIEKRQQELLHQPHDPR